MGEMARLEISRDDAFLDQFCMHYHICGDLVTHGTGPADSVKCAPGKHTLSCRISHSGPSLTGRGHIFYLARSNDMTVHLEPGATYRWLVSCERLDYFTINPGLYLAKKITDFLANAGHVWPDKYATWPRTISMSLLPSLSDSPDLVRSPPANAPPFSYDVFLSHASDDKDEVARPLATALSDRGHSVWLDDYELRIGDSLRRRIDHGIGTAVPQS